MITYHDVYKDVYRNKTRFINVTKDIINYTQQILYHDKWRNKTRWIDKTRWYNQQYLRAKKNDMLAEELQVILKAQNINVENSFVAKVCNELKERATFVSEMWEEGKYFFASPKEYDKKTLRKKWKDNIPEILLDLKERLGRIDDFKSEKIEQDFKEVLLKNNIGMGQLLPAFRLALTGIAMGPSLFNIAEIIGKEETIQRIDKALINIK